MLCQVCYRVSYAHVVYDEWGYDALLPYGRGISMLFAGKSGTGKTMAAQIMGKELGLDVYKVNLSQIVSKYIGETEKNINMIFGEAMKNNVILFLTKWSHFLQKEQMSKMQMIDIPIWKLLFYFKKWNNMMVFLY